MVRFDSTKTYNIGNRGVYALRRAQVHACDGGFGLGNEDRLAACRVQIFVLHVCEVEGAEGGAVHEESCGREICEDGGYGWVVAADGVDAFLEGLGLEPCSLLVNPASCDLNVTHSTSNREKRKERNRTSSNKPAYST